MKNKRNVEKERRLFECLSSRFVATDDRWRASGARFVIEDDQVAVSILSSEKLARAMINIKSSGDMSEFEVENERSFFRISEERKLFLSMEMFVGQIMRNIYEKERRKETAESRILSFFEKEIQVREEEVI
jgi:hypothetical protein